MIFEFCCNKPKIEEYSLTHNNLSQITKSELIDLILYLPEMESYQSFRNTFFSNEIYDEYLYRLFIKMMHLNDSDIKCIESSKPPIIDKKYGDYFDGKICTSCQKIIFQKRNNKNKITEIFRHIRNSISHGFFNIINNLFIGFDHPTYSSQEYSAVIKVNYANLIDTVNEIKQINSLEKLYEEVLKSFNYEIVDDNPEELFADLIVKKEGVFYKLKFKQFEGRYINQSDVQKFINELKCTEKTNCVFVLVVDSTYTNSKINAYVASEHISILDKKYVKEMLEGRDVLKELSDALI